MLLNTWFWPLVGFAAYLHSFSALCTMQYRRHCAVTFSSPRRLKRFSLLLLQILPKTGSMVCIRLLYNFLPSSLSMIFRILSKCVVLRFSSISSDNCRPCFFTSRFIHCVFKGQSRQSLSFPLKRICGPLGVLKLSPT